jgi:sugar lactone lactonase YvrE
MQSCGRRCVRAAAGLAMAAGLAQGQTLYVAEYQFQAARIASMNADGTNVQTAVSLAPADWLPLGLTVDTGAGRLIWVDSAGGSEVLSANLDGSGQTQITALSGFARGPSRDAQGRIYVASDNTIQRVNGDGSGLVTLFTSASSNPVGDPRVDATNGHVYFGDGGRIMRMDLDGGALKTVVSGLATVRSIGLDIAHGYIYWADSNTNSDFIGRARLDGSDFRVLIDNSFNDGGSSSGLISLLVDPAGGKLYYADELRGTVTRANLDGSGAGVIYTSPTGLSPSGLVFGSGEPAQALQDCNQNGISDDVDIAGGAPDCDNNGVIDTCQVSACPARVFLLDQGDDAANTLGRALGRPSEWEVFQPFDVPAGGWSVGEIGIDGFTVNYVGSPGVRVSLFADNGAGLPNETFTIASGTTDLRFNPDEVNWVYVPLTASLAEGRYWVRIEGIQPADYQGSINLGTTGLPSLSRGSSGVFGQPAAPIALRVVQGSACYANCDQSTAAPVLNVLDFNCFLNRFSAGDSYANCDQSTAAPVLNVLDFNCFLNRFSAGCP